MVKFRSPINKSWVNHQGHPNKDAADFGWRVGVANSQTQPIYSVGNGKIIYTGFISDGGNTIVGSYSYDSKYDMWVGYMHLSKIDVKENQNVSMAEKIGNMGNTGESHGSHLHVRMSLVPRGTKFSWVTFNKFKRLDPLKYLYEYPNQDVIDLQKLPKTNFVEQDGNITIIAPNGSNVRKEPSINSKRVGGLEKGQKINYTGYTDKDGYRWVKTAKGWVANRTLKEPIEYFAKAEFNKPQNNPKPQPKPTKVGKYANFGGWVRLFRKAVGDECYHSTKNGQNNVYTDVRETSSKILKEENGRVLVDVPRFNPSKVWIANVESTVTDQPLYEL